MKKKIMILAEGIKFFFSRLKLSKCERKGLGEGERGEGEEEERREKKYRRIRYKKLLEIGKR